MAPMMVAVVIINWNQAADTVACVQAIRAWPLAAEHIWVVDNASSGNDVMQLRRDCPNIHLICSPENRGFAGANNLALAEIVSLDYQAILLLNNDATIDAGSVAQLCDVLEQNPDVGVVGPTLWDADTPSLLLSAGGRDIAHHVASHILAPLASGQINAVDYVPGTCALIRIDILRAIGLLDEAFFFSGEVASLCKKAWLHRYRCLIVGDARATHAVHRSAGVRGGLHSYYVIRNRFLFVCRFYPRQIIPLTLFWLVVALYNSLIAALHGDTRRARAVALGCIDGLTGRFGGQNERVLRWIGSVVRGQQEQP